MGVGEKDYGEGNYELDMSSGGLISVDIHKRFDKIQVITCPAQFVTGEITRVGGTTTVPNLRLFTGRELRIQGKKLRLTFGPWPESQQAQIGQDDNLPAKLMLKFIVGDNGPLEEFPPGGEHLLVGQEVALTPDQWNLVGRVVTMYPPKGLCFQLANAFNAADSVKLARGVTADLFDAPASLVSDVFPGVTLTRFWLPLRYHYYNNVAPAIRAHDIDYPPGAWAVYYWNAAASANTVTKCKMDCWES